jgi:hypothetical protein
MRRQGIGILQNFFQLVVVLLPLLFLEKLIQSLFLILWQSKKAKEL